MNFTNQPPTVLEQISVLGSEIIPCLIGERFFVPHVGRGVILKDISFDIFSSGEFSQSFSYSTLRIPVAVLIDSPDCSIVFRYPDSCSCAHVVLLDCLVRPLPSGDGLLFLVHFTRPFFPGQPMPGKFMSPRRTAASSASAAFW